MITLAVLNEIPRVRHAFFTREGGLSDGLYRSLNCGPGSKDQPDAVAANRARIAEMLERPADHLVTVHQAHTALAVVVDAPFAPGHAPKADAMVTNRPGLVLGILTADCAPVLFADKKGRAVGAAHAGWRGAQGGVLDQTVARMAELGVAAADLVAVVGPCIAACSYEVGPEFPKVFLDEDPRNRDFFAKGRRDGHPLFDLPGYIARRLAQAGVGTIGRIPADTCRDEARFFSYRRSTLRGEPDYGRQISAIVLER